VPIDQLCVAVDSSGNVLMRAPIAPKLSVPRVVVGPAAEAEQLTAGRRGRLLRVDSGLAVACPPGGPACTVTGKAGEDALLVDLIARVHLTVPAGRRREIVFTLTARGARLLNREQGYIAFAVLTIVARAGRGAAVANTLLYSLAARSQVKSRPTREDPRVGLVTT
jgi:hypothetical protein